MKSWGRILVGKSEEWKNVWRGGLGILILKGIKREEGSDVG